MNKKSLIILLVLYIASTAISYAALPFPGKPGGAGSQSGEEQVIGEDGQPIAEGESELSKLLTIDPKEPKNQACPLNGELFTNTERQAWEKRRPLAVMIENHPDARPQSGLSDADLVFEAMAEGGVTRFMAMFYCGAQVYDVPLAPIRSARTYFVNYASGFAKPLYVHVGGANTPGPADALGQISDYGWNGQNDLNQFSIGYPVFVRDYNRVEGKDLATEHTMVSSTEKLWNYAADKRGWTNLPPERLRKAASKTAKTPASFDWKDLYTPWKFQDGSAGKGTVNRISFEFWTGFKDYAVTWEYDQATNSYKRILAGEPHVDLNNDKQIMAKNVVVLLTDEKGPIDDKKHLLYATEGTGDALIFQNGEAIKGKWAKKTRESQLTFTDAKGKELEFVRGLTWISIVGDDTDVSY